MYPNIAILARRLLCILATSAPAERLFSHAGLIISKARSALPPENAAVVILLQDSWETADNYLCKILGGVLVKKIISY